MHATIGSVRLYYELAGEADLPPLLLIHGLGSDHTTWAEVGPALAHHFQVITPDLRGFGSSDRPEGDYDPRALAGDLYRLLQVLGIERAAVLGHSMGGVVALHLALDFPEVVQALVVSDASSECHQAARDLWLQVADLVAAEGMAALTETIETRFSPEYVAQHPEAVARANQRLLDSDPRVYAAACRALAGLHEQPLTPQLGGIRCPTLVLVGEADIVTPPGASVIMHRRILGSVLRIFPGRGHSLHHEAPEEFTAAVIAFLTSFGV